MGTNEELFVKLFNQMSEEAHADMVRNGFWEQTRQFGTLIALMHSELSEALEAMRKGDSPDPKVPGFALVETELADVILRIMDMAGDENLISGGAGVEKRRHNRTRPHRHGKEF